MNSLKIEQPKTGILTITLNRPDKRNALSLDMLTSLSKTVNAARTNRANRVIIIKGEGPVFCTGMDLTEASNPEYASLTTEAIATMFASIHMTPLVTIAVVQGAAIAGGAGLAAACDFVVAEENAFFSFPETRRGLVAALVAALLMRQLSTRHIKELLLFGIKINSKRAYEIGLVNRVVTKKESLVEEAFKYAEEVLLGAPQATQKTKELIDALYPFSYEQMTNLAMQYHKEAKLSEEAQEGIEAFFNKRIPRWNQK